MSTPRPMTPWGMLKVGLGLLVIGAAGLYLAYIRPYMQVQNGESGIYFYGYLGFVAPLSAGLAVLLILMSPLAGRTREKETPLQVVLLLIGVAIIIGASVYLSFFWFPAEAEQLGYRSAWGA